MVKSEGEIGQALPRKLAKVLTQEFENGVIDGGWRFQVGQVSRFRDNDPCGVWNFGFQQRGNILEVLDVLISDQDEGRDFDFAEPR